MICLLKMGDVPLIQVSTKEEIQTDVQPQTEPGVSESGISKPMEVK
jgi:hypothetical protein